MLIAFSNLKKTRPHAVRENSALLEEFQKYIRAQGLETHWPKE
jgi:hypothetical protein